MVPTNIRTPTAATVFSRLRGSLVFGSSTISARCMLARLILRASGGFTMFRLPLPPVAVAPSTILRDSGTSYYLVTITLRVMSGVSTFMRAFFGFFSVFSRAFLLGIIYRAGVATFSAGLPLF